MSPAAQPQPAQRPERTAKPPALKQVATCWSNEPQPAQWSERTAKPPALKPIGIRQPGWQINVSYEEK